MFTLRRSEDRGHFDHGWLQTWHSFSFAQYLDPAHMGFDTLRVLNQDIVQPGAGFPLHGHADMEIITYVLRGSVEHQDSMGNRTVVPAGDVQCMTAGKGVQHAEANPSSDEELELMQIWILPERNGLEPSYEQRSFAQRGEGLQLIVSADGRDGSLRIHQDAEMHAARLGTGDSITHTLGTGRGAWVQVVRGEVRMGDALLRAGDGAGLAEVPEVTLRAESDAEVILFDLAPGPLGRGPAPG